MTISSTPIKL